MQTAGRAVVFSGTTVAIGLLALVALPVPFLRSVGYGGMLIPLISVIVALTLLPVVLGRLGPRLDWPHVRDDDKASRAWTGWAKLVVRRRWVAALGAALVLGGAGARRAPTSSWAPPNVNTIAKEGDAKQGLVALERSGIGSGVLVPDEVLVRRLDLDRERVAQRAGGRARRARRGRAATRRSGATRGRGGRRVPDPGRLDLAGRAATLERVRAAAHARERDVQRGRHRRPEQGLHRRRVRQLPADDRADRGDHLRAARTRVPLAAAAAEGGDAERDQRRRRVGGARRSCGRTATART